MSEPSRRSGDPQKWGTIAAGAAAVLVAGWMTLESTSARPIKKETEARPDAAPAVTASASAGPVVLLDASAAVLDLDAGLTLPTLSLDASLPTTAPRSVKIGVVMITYAGAEGAPPSARPKGQAKEIAEGLVSVARSDFHQAVGKGDSGSADDIGRVPRGVLDPAVESAVFALPASDVSDVIETPRGYWIVKRIE